MEIFRWLFKKKLETIHPPMDILRYPLADYARTGQDVYVSVHNKGLGGYEQFPISSGVNPMANRSQVYGAVKQACYGKVLDVGACVGDLSLELQNHGVNVTAIDVSEHCVTYMKRQGLKSCFQRDVWETTDEKYDTILLMGSTLGICERLEAVPTFLRHIALMLDRGGQIIIEDRHVLDPKGYVEFTTHLKYKNFVTGEFDWFNIGLEKLTSILAENGFDSDVLFQHEYLPNYVVVASIQ